MANVTPQQLFGVDPTEGFVQYTQSIKPYHTKILEVLIEYVYQEDIDVNVQERWNWVIDQTRPDVDVLTTCGFGVIWDAPFALTDYPSVKIVEAVGDTPIEVSFLTDPLNPTHVLVSYNPDQYLISVGDPVSFQTTETLPNTTTGALSSGKVYYVTSKVGNILEISPLVPPTLPTQGATSSPLTSPIVVPAPMYGPPLSFITTGTGIIHLHQENLQYNSFLVEQEPSTPFQCVAINDISNQFAFINTYNVTAVSPTIKQWTVSGISPGYQDVLFNASKILTDSTGLANDATVYTTTITVDGGAIPFSISVVGNTAQTYTALLGELNTTLGAFATASLVGGNVRIQSASISTSSIAIVDGVTPLFASLTDFNTINISVDSPVIPGKAIYVHNNGGNGVDGQYTIASATLSGSDTIITVDESISLLAQADGTVNIQDDFSLMPKWVLGTKVKVSSPGVLPTPLLSTSEYFFVPTNNVGVFTLSTKPIPLTNSDYVDIFDLGTGIINIERSELFYPGAVVQITGTYLSRNNGTYYVDRVVTEGSYLRVHVFQKVNRTTPSYLTYDGMMTLDLTYGFDYPTYCALLQIPDLYTQAFVHERIDFEFVVNLNDSIRSTLSEDDTGTHDTLVFPVSTAIASQSHILLPMGYDTQYFGLGVVDEDNHYDNHNLGNTM